MKKERSLPNPHAKELRTKKYRPKVIQNKKKKSEGDYFKWGNGHKKLKCNALFEKKSKYEF